MRARLEVAPLKWLLALFVLYWLAGFVFYGILFVADSITETESRYLLGKIHDGMTPAQVDSIMGRPSEYQYDYSCVPHCGPFSHNWTVRGHHVEVIFDRDGHAGKRFTSLTDDGPVGAMRAIFRRVFLWWLPDD